MLLFSFNNVLLPPKIVLSCFNNVIKLFALTFPPLHTLLIHTPNDVSWGYYHHYRDLFSIKCSAVRDLSPFSPFPPVNIALTPENEADLSLPELTTDSEIIDI
jgi:hypothetical protein